MSSRSSGPPPIPVRRFPILAVLFLSTVVFGCSIYANLSYAVTHRANYRFFPPFKPDVNANMNNHLGAEYLHIGRALARGKGFANPFGVQTGPTAWMPPVFPCILATLLRVCDSDRDAVMAVVIFLQAFVLVGTGLLVLALARQTTRLWASVAVTAYVLGVLCDFHTWFQSTHDCWLVLLAVDLLIAGLCWLRPLHHWQSAAGWGLFGGLCALINPIVAATWGILSIALGWRQRTWARLGLTLLAAGLTLLPWTVRNYLVFGRLLPVKSNVAYELYQSQCLQPDGLVQNTTFGGHPYASPSRERQEYMALGEIAFLERKREQFWQAVQANPQDFISRAGQRFSAATVWYVPFDRSREASRPWVDWLSRLSHPLPFLALLVLCVSAWWRPLHWAQRTVMGVYCLYLLPYIAVSYYDRYAMPLLGAKVLLVIWAIDRLLSWWPRRRTASGQQDAVLRPARPARLRPAVRVSQ
jgi:hypothetical protein